jgi:uncharacterized protein DUF5615
VKDESLSHVRGSVGRTWFYADENIDEELIRWLRDRKHYVESAREFGYAGRDDEFHIQEAARRHCILLSNDADYLDDRKFPFHALTNTGVVVLGTSGRSTNLTQYGYMLLALEDEIARSGTDSLVGLKIELRGPRILLRARLGGRVRTDEIDISKPMRTRVLFREEP